MACIPFSGPGIRGYIHCADHFVNLAPYGAKVWCEFHNRLGPTFYRSENAIKVIEVPSRKTWRAFSAWHRDTFGLMRDILETPHEVREAPQTAPI